MKTKPLMLAITSAVVLLCGCTTPQTSAQVAVPPPMPAYQPLSDQQLDQLLSPIALYPDPLLGEILPAATLPTQIVMADRYDASGGDPNLADQQPWDPSVQALTHYPSVLKYLDDNLAWTTALGQAFLYQQQQVMDSIQRLRISAQNYGNLQSTPQQQVVEDNGEIEILPVNPDVIYVPVYQPTYIYYQSGFGLSFGVPFRVGPWLSCDFDWVHRNLYIWNHDHPRPANFWHERPDQRTAWLANRGTVWHAEAHRDFDNVNRGDRGWYQSPVHVPEPRPVDHNDNHFDRDNNQFNRGQNNEHPDNRNNNRFNAPHPAEAAKPATLPHPTPDHNVVEWHAQNQPAQAYRPSNGAFIGSESAHDARTFSDRGQQSRGVVTHSPTVHYEPSHAQPVHSEPAPSHSPATFQGGRGPQNSDSHPKR